MRVFAMFLPQFHRVKENDEWWGEGFTDWVSTKKAKPLFGGHYQPHVPMNANYYDLSEKHTMLWQATLMKKYGVDGMCIYHYWFKDGRQILQKPAENLLQWKDVDMPFCFYWANETWARSWSNIQNVNTWSDMQEKDGSNQEKSILLEQTYGELKEWKEHFEYFLPFFKDERYIKIDGKPLVLIYRIADIPCLQEMISYWRQLAYEEGLEGLYIIGARANEMVTDEVDAFLIHEPAYSMGRLELNKFNNTEQKIDYCEVWDKLLSSARFERKTFYCGFSGYDDTPRRGKNGTVINHATPYLFHKYMKRLFAKSESEGNDIVFLNAWNEWGEGMHLEPDELFKEAYLQALKNAKEEYKNLSFEGNLSVNNEMMKELRAVQKQSDKYEKYLNLMDVWMNLREASISLDSYFLAHHYARVAIYGYGILGRHMESELCGTDINLVGIIDKKKEKLQTKLPVYSPEETLPEMDVLVITSYFFYNEIVKELGERPFKIIPIDTIINQIYLEYCIKKSN